MRSSSYRDLEVWHLARELNRRVYRFTNKLPWSEQDNLVKQLTKASTSVPSNIAEGFMRRTTREYIRFLDIARASNEEVYTQLNLCIDVGYFKEYELRSTLMLSGRITQILDRMMDSLEIKARWQEEEAKREKQRRKKQ